MTDQQAKALDILVRALGIQEEKRDTPIHVALQAAIAERRVANPGVAAENQRTIDYLEYIVGRLRIGELRCPRVDFVRDKFETTLPGDTNRTFEAGRTSTVTLYLEYLR